MRQYRHGPKPQVRYVPSKGAYFFFRDNTRHRLTEKCEADHPTGPNYMAALDAYKDFIRLGNVTKAGDANTVDTILAQYCAWATEHKKLSPQTLAHRLNYAMKPFCEKHGTKPVSALTPTLIEDFIAKMRRTTRSGGNSHRKFRWGNGAVGTFHETLTVAFNWAFRRGLISANPMLNVARPDRCTRSRDCIITADDHQRILAECCPSLRRIVVCLEATGCRPGELLGATAKDWDDSLPGLVYHRDGARKEGETRHKNARKGKTRKIIFTGEALTIMRELVAAHPSGPLFHSSKGTPYKLKSLCNCFRPVRRRVKLPRLTPYSYRHTFATNWLVANRSIDKLAHLMGNSAFTLRAHYDHLLGDDVALREAMESFTNLVEAPSKTPTPSVQQPTVEASPTATV